VGGKGSVPCGGVVGSGGGCPSWHLGDAYELMRLQLICGFFAGPFLQERELSR